MYVMYSSCMQIFTLSFPVKKASIFFFLFSHCVLFTGPFGAACWKYM